MRLDPDLLQRVHTARGAESLTAYVEQSLRLRLGPESEPDAKEELGRLVNGQIDDDAWYRARVKQLRAEGVGTYKAMDQAQEELNERNKA